MTRLTKTLREQALKNALEHSGLVKKEADFYKEVADFVEKQWRKIYSHETEAIVNKMYKELSDTTAGNTHYLSHRNRNSSIDLVGKSGEKFNIYFSGSLDYYKNSSIGNKYRITPSNIPQINLNKKETDYCLGLSVRESRILEEIKEAELIISSVLESCNTYKQLIDKWPEASEILPTPPVKVKSTEIVDINKLNKLTKLPGKK